MDDFPEQNGPEVNSQIPPAGTSPGEMTRLFLVPLLIVGVMVGCSAMVVLLFGKISTGKEERIESLVTQIESAAGLHNFFGGMWPKDKEMWQAAQELTVRLERMDEEIPVELRPDLARRLAAALEDTLGLDPGKLESGLRESLAYRQRFLIRSLGLLGRPEGLPVLLACLEPGQATGEAGRVALEQRRQYAAEALALLPGTPGVEQAVPVLSDIVRDEGAAPPLRMVCVITISLLADSDAEPARDAVYQAYLSSDREVRWNAGLALARMGDSRSRPLLRDMLTREFWSDEEMARVTGDDGVAYRTRLSPVQIEGYLMAAIQASRSLGAPELEPLIEKLADDASLKVREEVLRGPASGPVKGGQSG